jgi:Transglycosylase SLT domain
MGRHEAYRPTVSERASKSFDSWLSDRGLARPKPPVIPRGALLPYFAFAFVTGLMYVTAVDPYAGNLAAAYADDYAPNVAGTQIVDVITPTEVSFARGGFNIIAGSDFARVFVADAGIPDAGTAQAFARDLAGQLGWGQDQYSCLVKLWNRESNWNVLARNSDSGAYGIPQALPGTRMASEGSDWMTNPQTQVRWGVKYIKGRYGTPCTALVHSNNLGWY